MATKQKMTYKGFEDFMPAFTTARMAAKAEISRWDLDPSTRMNARLPAAWANCKIFGGTKKSPRDVAFPVARFWPNGVLPVGPVYASLHALDQSTIEEFRAAQAKTNKANERSRQWVRAAA